MATSTTTASLRQVMYLIHHMFLPPKLPQKNDNTPELDCGLLELVARTCHDFSAMVEPQQRSSVMHVCDAIDQLIGIRGPQGEVDEVQLKTALKERKRTIPLHIKAQNAGVLISKNNDNDVTIFEAFEVSPLNNAAMNTKGRLRREFPGTARAVKSEHIKEDGFQITLAETLAKMSHQPGIDMQPKVRKAGEDHDEDRDTTHPGLVTELVDGVLGTLSSPASFIRIEKNTREEVLWSDCRSPWRRAPLWLFVRVVMRMLFGRTNSSSSSNMVAGRRLFKLYSLFLLSNVLNQAMEQGFLIHPDLIYSMSAKIVQRMMKLNLTGSEPGIDFVKDTLIKTKTTLERRWSDIMTNNGTRHDLTPLQRLEFENDINLALPQLDTFIASIHLRHTASSSTNFQPSPDLNKYWSENIPATFSSSSSDYLEYNLLAFEKYIASFAVHHNAPGTCDELKALMVTYHKAAIARYLHNPERISIMILTVLELWVACDKSAVQAFGLLQDYNPGVPLEMLQSLILPLEHHMSRLLSIENYVERRQPCHKTPALILRDFGSDTSFAVRYFNKSPQHQKLRDKIEEKATEDRRMKREELARNQQEYARLMRLHDSSNCQDVDVWSHELGQTTKTHIAARCRKCSYREEARKITIEVHEWPLPSNDLQAKSVVFELDVPHVFSAWRDATTFLLLDVLGLKHHAETHPISRNTLQKYEGLSSHYQARPSERVGLLSEAKPHGRTHRRDKIIAEITESEVCVQNGLKYEYFDNTVDCFFRGSLLLTDEVLNMCTYSYQLPAVSNSLQQFLLRSFKASYTSHVDSTPNTVIASQCNSPDHMSLAEYRALAAIPIGYRIQWKNILLQLACPTVDLKKVETSLVILQSIYQAGPRENFQLRRAGHVILDDNEFAAALLDNVEKTRRRIEENWESLQALGTLIFVTARLSSLNSSIDYCTRALGILTTLRQIAFGWMKQIRKKCHETHNDAQRADFLAKAVEIALICCSTFDVEDRYLVQILNSTENASTFVQCAIVIQECSAPSGSAPTSDIQFVMRQRWQRVSYHAYPHLVNRIVEQQDPCLDDSIREAWPAYQRGENWQTSSSRTDHWLVTRTAKGAGISLQVHYNLLTGLLLVNGLPLARLPSEYEQHPAYRKLFGKFIFQVMPTNVPGLQFSSQQRHEGYTIHFGLDKTDLLIHAVGVDKRFELVPCRVFNEKIPHMFVNEYVHWYNEEDGTVEFRVVDQPWVSSDSTWRLPKSDSGWRLTRNGTSLLDPDSKTGNKLAAILSPLQERLNIHIVLMPDSLMVEIDLPSLQLAFQLKKESSVIQSRQFRDMSIDGDQSIDTLLGLKNKLVLKTTDQAEGQRQDRMIIVPFGEVSYCKDGDHTTVSIIPSSQPTFSYRLDTRLGRLTDNGSLQSQLFLCYLHGLTSFCLPDPLTKRTGTEQALTILKSAAVKSFMFLNEDNMGILAKIEALAPRRSYYPPHAEVMQSIQWDAGLGFLAQHAHFHDTVVALYGQNEISKLYYPNDFVKPPEVDTMNAFLHQRDSLRSSTFRISGFGAEDFSDQFDRLYDSRDRGQASDRAQRALSISTIMLHRKPSLQNYISSDLSTRLWNTFQFTERVCGPGLVPPETFKYDSKWLHSHHLHYAQLWCSLHRQFSASASSFDMYQLMLWLATMAFSKEVEMDFVQTIAAMLMIPAMNSVDPPSIESFSIRDGYQVSQASLEQEMYMARLSYSNCPESTLPVQSWETSKAAGRRRYHAFQINQKQAVKDFSTFLAEQFPCEQPVKPQGSTEATLRTHLNLRIGTEAVGPKFKVWFQNWRLWTYLQAIDKVLVGRVPDPLPIPDNTFMAGSSLGSGQVGGGKRFITPVNIFADCPAPTIPETRASRDTPHAAIDSRANFDGRALAHGGHPTSSTELDNLIQDLEARINSSYERTYVTELKDSNRELQKQTQETGPKSSDIGFSSLLQHLSRCQQRTDEVYRSLQDSSRRVDGADVESFLLTLHHTPRLSPVFYVQQLSYNCWKSLPDQWRSAIIQYGVALTELQRAERLTRPCLSPNDLAKESGNKGHTNWDSMEFPESLLLEVESGILIRDVQEHIASQMRDPENGRNAVMQLNMGEGKSSVIVPIVATALANHSNLVRVIVAKPQSKQMFHMLVSKLGGMLNRRVFHMPFSRALRPTERDANLIHDMCQQCIDVGGVMLVQPEHILSFKLMGLECMIAGKEAVGRSLLDTQRFFDKKTRDIVDESDENFSVKFELIYTMGSQCPIEFAPERWSIIQTVLGLVRLYAPGVKDQSPLGIELHEGVAGCFPRVRPLKADTEALLSQRVARHICDSGLSAFPIPLQNPDTRDAVFKYITEPELPAQDVSRVENGPFWTESTKSALLLLRGLLAEGVLAFSLAHKRWRVNYGLDSTRVPKTKLAVPYRAKDNPSPRSEFSHPDVIITMTCLSYYYGGLCDDDLFLAFGSLIDSDQADTEYHEWVSDAPSTLPAAFHQLQGINLKDTAQCVKEVFPPMRYAKAAIDYFLSAIVFPKFMREFPKKLSASGWDIGAVKPHPTTGFSGTIDSRQVLPLDVIYLDLPEQKHTNALVLQHLLQPENGAILLPSHQAKTETDRDNVTDAEALLNVATGMQPPVRVILDVGAQILELTNVEVAQRWLEMLSHEDSVQAAVFFDDNEELSVLDLKGQIESFQTSPYAEQLDTCVVFLDEAHTRGTDLRLPESYRAVVTLGANLTKDRLVQACMRMRKLGKGQSVVFCIPEEIRTKMQERRTQRDVPPTPPQTRLAEQDISVLEVLSWAIGETHSDLRRSMPLWAVQGQRFDRQEEMWAQSGTDDGSQMSKAQAEEFLEDEAQTLENRYRPRKTTNDKESGTTLHIAKSKRLEQIHERCLEVGSLDFSSATLQEEQERELSPEIEKERQVEKPPPAPAAAHSIHKDVRTFVSSGVLPASSTTFLPAFSTLRDTTAAVHLDVGQFPHSLLVTEDFARTVSKSGRDFISDAYQRPVQWILTNSPEVEYDTTMVIISPFEAQELLPDIQSSSKTTLHVYAPRPNLEIRPLDGLGLYVVPSFSMAGSWCPRRDLVVQLNLFSGQLYFDSYDGYKELCGMLGLSWEAAREGIKLAADGFILPETLGDGAVVARGPTFKQSPVKFLKVFLTKIRRDCQSIEKTHVGKILDGVVLPEETFQ